MPRPAGPLAHVMDAEARALDLPPWDEAERQLVLVEVGQRVAAARALLARCHYPHVERLLAEALALLEEWRRGDDRENEAHRGILEDLRRAAGGLDRGRT